MSTLSSLVKVTSKFISDNSPTILTGMAAGGVVSTAILAAKGGGPAYQDILHAESETTESLSLKDKAFLTYKHYIPAFIAGSGTIVCLVAAHTASSHRTAAVMSAYSVLENSFNEFKDKALEIHGENKVKRIRDEIAQDRVTADPPSNKEVFVTGKGEQMFRDEHTKRYFRSTINDVDAIRNQINEMCINDMYATLNDYYRLIGIDTISHGDDYGWRPEPEKMLDYHKSFALTDDGEAVITIDYDIHPIRNI